MTTTKSDAVRELVANGDYKRALSIVKGFRRGINKDDLGKMALAYECLVHTGFYEQLGTDTTAAITEGIRVLRTLYDP
jgi:hypothetical protein